MSVITKLKQLFTKQEATQVLGIALRPNSLAYCVLPKSFFTQQSLNNQNSNSSRENDIAIQCQQVSAGQVENYTLIENLIHTDGLHGSCNLILSSTQYQIVQIDKPDLPDEEIAAALRWQVKDLVSYSPDDMVLDYFDAPKQQGVNEKLNVVCTPASPLKKLVEVLNNEHISLKNINIEEFAFARLLPYSDDAQLMVCQQPEEDIFIIIVKQGQLCFQRRLRGFSQIATKTEEELGYGLIDSLSLEIQKSSDYFERQLKQSVIKKIQVVLPVNSEKFIVDKLAANTNVPVHLLALPSPFAAYREMAAAIGATLLDQQLDLSAQTLLATSAQSSQSEQRGEHE